MPTTVPPHTGAHLSDHENLVQGLPPNVATQMTTTETVSNVPGEVPVVTKDTTVSHTALPTAAAPGSVLNVPAMLVPGPASTDLANVVSDPMAGVLVAVSPAAAHTVSDKGKNKKPAEVRQTNHPKTPQPPITSFANVPLHPAGGAAPSNLPVAAHTPAPTPVVTEADPSDAPEVPAAMSMQPAASNVVPAPTGKTGVHWDPHIPVKDQPSGK